ncbi:MAG: TonB family protein [Sutterellaceae bacterium]|nr:TonB family protein [Burkholderiaceae bacterium]MCX7901693.1 TonB family protein [Burkholderiaceae bacterium]MDW8429100.1 TonB family protein [Sutterellaceae bacterium]
MLVGALHVLAAAVVLAATGMRELIAPPRPVEVRLIDAPQPPRSDPPKPIPTAPKAVAPAATVPLPEVPPMAPPEEPAIAAAAAPVPADPAPTAPAPVGSLGSAGEPAPAAAAPPVLVEQVAYAHFVPPQYPAVSRRLGEQGLVVLRVLIDEEGRPVAVDVHQSSGFARLDQAAAEAVRRARFRPHREGDRPRAAIALVPVRFELT